MKIEIVHGILGEMRFAEETTPWFCDSCGTIQVASKAGFRGPIKTVDVKLMA